MYMARVIELGTVVIGPWYWWIGQVDSRLKSCQKGFSNFLRFDMRTNSIVINLRVHSIRTEIDVHVRMAYMRLYLRLKLIIIKGFHILHKVEAQVALQ